MSSLSAHDGLVLAAVRLFVIYWGRTWGSPEQGYDQAARDMDLYLSEVVSGRYMDLLANYGAGRGQFVGSTWIDHDPASAVTIDQNGLISALSSWIDQGVVPVRPGVPDESALLFMIMLPEELTLAFSGDENLCGFHWWGFYQKPPLGKANLFFGVVETRGNFDPHVSASHELVEAVTDRDGDGWYADDSGAEIGDACSACGDQVLFLEDGPPVASYWVMPPDDPAGGHCLSQDDLTPPHAADVTMTPDQLVLRRPQTFTLTVTDAVTGEAAGRVDVGILNYSPQGLPVHLTLPPAPSPVTTTITFHPGRRFDVDTHTFIYDLVPMLDIRPMGLRETQMYVPFQDSP
jgi:hypothetical protein